MRILKVLFLYILPFGVAGYAVVAYTLFPAGALVHPDMAVVFQANWLGIYLHVFGAAVALVLGPFQFASTLRALHPRVHRWMGRAYLGVGVLIGGGAGLYMAVLAFGGIVSKLGFAFLAVAWLYTGLRALVAIRQGTIAAHQRWMVRNYGLTLAAVTLRLYLPLSGIAGIPFEAAYPAIAWLCWVPNLFVAEWLLKRHLYV